MNEEHQENDICLTPNCGGPCGRVNGVWTGGRGLCKPCHAIASRLVRERKTTWLWLERQGLAKPLARQTPFMRAFEVKKNGGNPSPPVDTA